MAAGSAVVLAGVGALMLTRLLIILRSFLRQEKPRFFGIRPKLCSKRSMPSIDVSKSSNLHSRRRTNKKIDFQKKGAFSMPGGDGTGPSGRGPRGRGGVGRGMGRGRNGLNPGVLGSVPEGVCVCSNCGAEIRHQVGIPCSSVNCPKCGTSMTRKASI